MKYVGIKAVVLCFGILSSSDPYSRAFLLEREQVDALLFKAFQYEKSGKIGNALIEYLKAQKNLKDDMAFSLEITHLVERWKDKNSVLIGLIVLSDPTNEMPRNDLRLFSDCVMEEIFSQKPDIVNIIESEKLDEILQTHKMILSNRKQIIKIDFSKLKQIDYLIFLSLSGLKGIEEEISTEEKSKRYPLKTEKILNPNWLEANQAIQRLKEELDQKQRELLQANAANDSLSAAAIGLAVATTQLELIDAKSRLDKLEKYNSKITFDDWRYQIKYIKKKTSMTVSYNVISVASNKEILANQLERSISFEDNLTENSNPAIGIPMHPLNLPTDESIRYRLYSLVSFELMGKIFPSLHKVLADRYLANALMYSDRGKKDEALEFNINYLLFCESQWTASHVSAQKYIEMNKEFVWERDLAPSLMKKGEK